MSSPDKASGEINNAAHPPAVKVGGMRITQNKSHLIIKKTDTTPVPKPEEEALKVSNSPPKQSILTSGATPRGNADFPADAVRDFHVKPIPTHDPQGHHAPHNIIHQPKK